MTLEAERSSILQLRGCLLSALDFAEELADDKPEYANAVTHFAHEVRQIKKDFMSSIGEDPLPSAPHDVLAGITGALTVVSILLERHPEKGDHLKKFIKRLEHVREEFIQRVWPDANAQA